VIDPTDATWLHSSIAKGRAQIETSGLIESKAESGSSFSPRRNFANGWGFAGCFERGPEKFRNNLSNSSPTVRRLRKASK
jgi:hypothetical protein